MERSLVETAFIGMQEESEGAVGGADAGPGWGWEAEDFERGGAVGDAEVEGVHVDL